VSNQKGILPPDFRTKIRRHDQVTAQLIEWLAWIALVIWVLVGAARYACGAEPTIGDAGLPQPLRTPAAAADAPYAIEFDVNTGNARWAMEVVTLKSLEKKADRSDRFYPDETLPAWCRARDSDFHLTGMDRGHLICSANHRCSQKLQNATFCFSNIVLQDSNLNEHFWAVEIEGTCRKLCEREDDKLFIVTIPGYRPNGQSLSGIRTFGDRGLCKPREFFKTLYRERGGKPDLMIAWCVPNRSIPDGVSEEKYRVLVRFVETRVGMDLYPEVPQPRQEQLETSDAPVI